MKRGTKILLTILVSLLVVGLLATAGLFYFREHYLLWNGIPLHRQAKTVDLKGKPLDDLAFLAEFPDLQILNARGTGMTPQQYEELIRTYGRLEILWDVPFQGGTIESDAQKIKLTSLTEEDWENLSYLRQMKSIDAWECEDYAALAALQEQLPECKIFYSVALAGQEYDCDIRELVLKNADGAELLENLKYLPNVTRVALLEQLPPWEQLEKILETYPDIAFDWEIVAFGSVFGREIRELTVKKNFIRSAAELEQVLPYVPELERVDLLECDLDQEELVDLALRWPEIDFVFQLQIGHVTVRTDMEEIDISNHKFESTDQVERYVNCFPNLKKVVMCECGIPNEEMDALNKKYEDIRFVWSVMLGFKMFRTDAIYYTPNSWGDKCFDETLYNLRYCTDMVCVDIGHMDAVTNCEWAAFMPNLKYLVLAQTGIRDLTPLSNLKNLVFLELFQSSVKDYSPLLGCTALEDLNLSYTYGDPEPIYQMTWLKRIWWGGCWWEARNKLPQTHPHAELEFHEVSSTGGTWREGKNYYDMRDFIGMDYMSG